MATKKKTMKKTQPKRTNHKSTKHESMPNTILKPINQTTQKAQGMMSKTIKGVQKGMKNPDVTDTIAKGAVGVAITAGVVAAGAAMMNKQTRKKVGRTAKIGFDKLSEYASMLAEEGQEQYQTVASRVVTPKKQTTSKRSHKKSSRAKR